MAKPIVGDSIAFSGPPIDLMTSNKQLYDFLLMIYDHIYGLGGSGSLNNDNIINTSNVTVDHNSTISITAYQHHGAGQHANLDQAAAQADFGGIFEGSEVLVTSPTAIDEPTVITLANENKIATNQLVDDLNFAVSQLSLLAIDLNQLKGKLRAGKLMAT